MYRPGGPELTFDEEPVVQSARLPAYEQALQDPADRSMQMLLQPPRNRRGQLRRRTLRSVLTREHAGT